MDLLCLPQDLKRVNSYLKSCFLIFPNYNLGHGLMELAYNQYINEYYAKIGRSGPQVLQGALSTSPDRPSVSRSVSQDEISI